jgi:RNA polymerase sigma-70 factor (ECF subfamily)
MRRFNPRPIRRSGDDDERFTVLYEQTSQDLLAFLLRRCPTAEDAADCLAETYRIAWEKRSRVPAGDEMRPWLFGVARNVARSERRSDERVLAAVQELTLAAARSLASTTSEDNAVTAALSELSPLDQEIITMISWDALTPREVASVLGLSPNAVRIRAHRGRNRLRGLLATSASTDTPAPTVATRET